MGDRPSVKLTAANNYATRVAQGKKALTIWMNRNDLVVFDKLRETLVGLPDAEILRMGVYQLWSTLGNRSSK